MNALRRRLTETFPNKQEGVAELVLDQLAAASPQLKIHTMDALAKNYLDVGIPDPFTQQVRQAIMNGDLDKPDNPSVLTSTPDPESED